MRPDSKTEPPEPTGVADHASHCAQVALALRRGQPKRMGDERVHPVPGRDPTTSSIDTAKKIKHDQGYTAYNGSIAC